MAHADVAASTPHYQKIAFEESKARSAATVAAAWDAGPGKELRSLTHAVARIREALENRDYRVRDALLSPDWNGLEKALDEIRKREERAARQREIEAARAAKQGNIYGFPERGNQQGMDMPAPRMA